MAKIICITTGLTGILHASYKLVSLLEKAGHEVIYACPWDVKKKVENQGFRYQQLNEIDFDPVSKVTEYNRRLSKFIYAKKRRWKAAELIETHRFEDLLSDFRPDLVLIDMELHDLIITSVSKRIPTVLLSQWFSVWKDKQLPPLETDILPSGNLFEIPKAWFKADMIQFFKVARNRLLTGFTDRASVLREFAKLKGFPVRELSERFAFPPPLTYRSLPVLSLTDWELEFPHHPRPNLYYAGSMVYENRADPQSDAGTTKKLAELLKEKKRTGFKLIYCSLSTMNKSDQGFIDRVIRAVAGRSDWRMIIALGGVADNSIRKDLPENVFAFEWVAQLKVLKDTDLSINHGGVHTINECIHFGVPMLVYSGKQYDQNGCAARVSFHGIGINGDRDSDGAGKIESRITQILEDSGYHRRISRLSKAQEKSKNKFSDRIEQFLSSGRFDPF